MQEVRYKNSCKECSYLGIFEEYDLYACRNSGWPMVVARYGDGVDEQFKGLGKVKKEPLQVAQLLAVKRGIIGDSEMEGAKTGQILLKKILDEVKDGDFATSNAKLLPNLPLRRRVIEQLLRNKNENIRMLMTERGDLTDGDLQKLINDESVLVRCYLAERFQLAEKFIYMLGEDPSLTVLNKLNGYQKLPYEIAYLLEGEDFFDYKRSYPNSKNTNLIDEVGNYSLLQNEKLNNDYSKPVLIEPFENFEDYLFLDFLLWKGFEEENWQAIVKRKQGTKENLIKGEVVLPKNIDCWLTVGILWVIEKGKASAKPFVVGHLQGGQDKRLTWGSRINSGGLDIGIVDSFKEYKWKKGEKVKATCLGMVIVGSTLNQNGRGLLALWTYKGKKLGWTREERANLIPEQREIGRENLLAKIHKPKLEIIEKLVREAVTKEIKL